MGSARSATSRCCARISRGIDAMRSGKTSTDPGVAIWQRHARRRATSPRPGSCRRPPRFGTRCSRAPRISEERARARKSTRDFSRRKLLLSQQSPSICGELGARRGMVSPALYTRLLPRLCLQSGARLPRRCLSDAAQSLSASEARRSRAAALTLAARGRCGSQRCVAKSRARAGWSERLWLPRSALCRCLVFRARSPSRQMRARSCRQ